MACGKVLYMIFNLGVYSTPLSGPGDDEAGTLIYREAENELQDVAMLYLAGCAILLSK